MNLKMHAYNEFCNAICTKPPLNSFRCFGARSSPVQAGRCNNCAVIVVFCLEKEILGNKHGKRFDYPFSDIFSVECGMLW